MPSTHTNIQAGRFLSVGDAPAGALVAYISNAQHSVLIGSNLSTRSFSGADSTALITPISHASISGSGIIFANETIQGLSAGDIGFFVNAPASTTGGGSYTPTYAIKISSDKSVTFAGGVTIASLTVSGNLIVTGTISEGGTSLVSKYLGIGATAVNSQLLDSLDSLQFLRSDEDDTFDGYLTVYKTSSSQGLIHLGGGTVGTSQFAGLTFSVNGTSDWQARILRHQYTDGILEIKQEGAGEMILSAVDSSITIATPTINSTSITNNFGWQAGADTLYMTMGKDRTLDGSCIIDFITAGISDGYEARISRSGGSGGNLVFENRGTGTLSFTAVDGEVSIGTDSVRILGDTTVLKLRGRDTGSTGNSSSAITFASHLTSDNINWAITEDQGTLGLRFKKGNASTVDALTSVMKLDWSSTNVMIASDTDNTFGKLQVTGNGWFSGNLYENSALLSATYLGITAKASDSDKLDNLDSTQFLRSDTADSMVGNLDITGTLIVTSTISEGGTLLSAKYLALTGGTVTGVTNVNNVLRVNTTSDDSSGAKLQVAGKISTTLGVYSPGANMDIATTDVNGRTVISGGTGGASSGNIVLRGSGAASAASNIEFRSGSVIIAQTESSTKSFLVNTSTDDGSGAKLQVAGDVSITPADGSLFFGDTNKLIRSSISNFVLENLNTGTADKLYIRAKGGGIVLNDVADKPVMLGTSTDNTSGAILQVQGSGTITSDLFVGTSTDDGSSAKLQVAGGCTLTTTTGALTVSRMTTTQRDALTPINGMVVYNTTTTAWNFYEAGAWVTK